MLIAARVKILQKKLSRQVLWVKDKRDKPFSMSFASFLVEQDTDQIYIRHLRDTWAHFRNTCKNLIKASISLMRDFLSCLLFLSRQALAKHISILAEMPSRKAHRVKHFNWTDFRVKRTSRNMKEKEIEFPIQIISGPTSFHLESCTKSPITEIVNFKALFQNERQNENDNKIFIIVKNIYNKKRIASLFVIVWLFFIVANWSCFESQSLCQLFFSQSCVFSSDLLKQRRMFLFGVSYKVETILIIHCFLMRLFDSLTNSSCVFRLGVNRCSIVWIWVSLSDFVVKVQMTLSG